MATAGSTKTGKGRPKVVKDELMTRLLISARGYKGHLKHQIDTINRRLTAFQRKLSEFGIAELLDSLKTAQATTDNLSKQIHKLMELEESTQEFETHEEDLDSYFERYAQTKEEVLESC